MLHVPKGDYNWLHDLAGGSYKWLHVSMEGFYNPDLNDRELRPSGDCQTGMNPITLSPGSRIDAGFLGTMTVIAKVGHGYVMARGDQLYAFLPNGVMRMVRNLPEAIATLSE